MISIQVTDELFDEIATKVLDEDDLAVEGMHALIYALTNFCAFAGSSALEV